MRAKDAKEIPIWLLLSRLGYEPYKETKGEKWYLSPFRDETVPSFKLSRDGRAWYDHGLGQGGSIIDFMLAFEQVSDVRAALRRLEAVMGSGAASTPRATQPELPLTDSRPASVPEDDAVITRISDLEHPALRQYLERERAIPFALALPYLKEIHYSRNGRAYFALGFANDATGYELRNKFFKGVIGHKTISTLHGDSGSDTVAVFEGFMDYFSFLAFSNVSEPGCRVIVLNGTGQQQVALDAIRKMGVREAHLYFDRDAAGRELTRAFTETLHADGIAAHDQSELYAGAKDFNDHLLRRRRTSAMR